MVDEGIKYANKKIMEKAGEDENLRGMGTTWVVAYIEDGQLFVANIGDSRLYLLDKQINQVTEDHSFVATLVRAGELTPAEARVHPDKNVITRLWALQRMQRSISLKWTLSRETRFSCAPTVIQYGGRRSFI